MPGGSPACRTDQSHGQWASLWVCHILGHYVLVIFTRDKYQRSRESSCIPESVKSFKPVSVCRIHVLLLISPSLSYVN